MGGPGSGNWYRSKAKKVAVEESSVLTVKALRTHLAQAAVGALTLHRVVGGLPSVGYFITPKDPTDVVLHYPRRGDYVWLRVRMVTTPAAFGGVRWWFTCPLARGGVACGRRTGKLYLPPHARLFGCRTCHELTYRSAQQSHKAERLFGGMGLGDDVIRFFSKRLDRELLG